MSHATAAAAASTKSAASAMLPVSRVTGRMPAMWRGCTSSNLQRQQVSTSMADHCSSPAGPQEATHWAYDAVVHTAPERCAAGRFSASALPVVGAQAQVEGLRRAAIAIWGAHIIRYLHWLDDEGWQHVLQPC